MIGPLTEDYFSEFVMRTNPTPPMVSEIQRLHQTIRGLFDETTYDTFLQGSYRNDTATKEINDVDIVVLLKHTVSTVFSKERYEAKRPWENIRSDIYSILNSYSTYRGRITPDEKCFRLSVGYEVDIVPAVRIAPTWEGDPIAIYNTAAGEISTSPRNHSHCCEAKNQATNETFKPLVRLFKWWARRNTPEGVAPSFYVESLLYNVDNRFFTGNYGSSFVAISKAVLDNLTPVDASNSPGIITPGERKSLFSQVEWSPDNYSTFYQRLLASYQIMRHSAAATSIAGAIGLWKQILGEEFPSRT